MANRDQLLLHEEVLLLALKDEAGTVAFESMHEYAMAGAMLAELLLRHRIRLGGRKGKIVELVNSGSLGDPVIDECLQKIRDAKRRARLETWVQRFAGVRNLTQRVAERLCDRGILRANEKTILLFFKKRIFPEVNPAPERELIERMRAAIFTDTADIEPRTAVLVSLARSADLLPIVFDKKSLRRRKKRLALITDGEATGKATQEAITAVTASAAVIGAIAVTSTGN